MKVEEKENTATRGSCFFNELVKSHVAEEQGCTPRSRNPFKVQMKTPPPKNEQTFSSNEETPSPPDVLTPEMNTNKFTGGQSRNPFRSSLELGNMSSPSTTNPFKPINSPPRVNHKFVNSPEKQILQSSLDLCDIINSSNSAVISNNGSCVDKQNSLHLKSSTTSCNVSKTVDFSVYILSVYSPFSDKVGLPLYSILCPFLSVMNNFSADLKFCHIHFNTLTMCLLVFQAVFCLQRHIFLHHMSLHLTQHQLAKA